MPLKKADEADDLKLNRLIWYSVKGYGVAYPKLGLGKTEESDD